MIQNILHHLGGIEHYGIVSLSLFATVFIGVLIWAGLQSRAHLERMARVPLENQEERNSHE